MKLPAPKRMISNSNIAVTFVIIILVSVLTSCKKFNNDNNTNNEIYTAVDEQAQFPGGMDAFYAFLTKNIQYPVQARRDNVQGRVIAQFVVEKDGSLSNIKIALGIGDGCDEEVVRVLKLSPKWIPGQQGGVVVRSQYAIPVNFVLVDQTTAVALYSPTSASVLIAGL